MRPQLLLILAFASLSVSGANRVRADSPVDFNRDVKPILSGHCFACHGPADQKAGMRLDTFEGATAKAIAPGEPGASEMLRRVSSDDPSVRMPPPQAKKPALTAEEIDVLRRWIAAGAEYEKHWSFQPPKRPEPPRVENEEWVRNPIDRFIAARLEAEGLSPAGEADRRALGRRVSLDLTGLPPEPEVVEEFVADTQPKAYERLVEKLLASPRWGEHRARYWLDYARYGDTHGIHFDNFREMWTYRDWLIGAFNANKPFDEFTIESLAGDLLPAPTLDQRIATGFNRCNITTNEGGVIPEEYLVLYTRDRVETTSLTWMGLTAGCAVCHDHKYDPLSQREFYELAAFFNNSTQGAMDGNIPDTPPVVMVPRQQDRERWDELPGLIAAVKERIKQRRQTARPEFGQWVATATPGDALRSIPTDDLHVHAPLSGDGEQVDLSIDDARKQLRLGEKLAWREGPFGENALYLDGGHVKVSDDAGDFDADQPFSCSAWVNLSAHDGSAAIVARIDDPGAHRGWDLWLQGRRVGAHIIHDWPAGALKVLTRDQLPANEWVHVTITYDGSKQASGLRVYVNGEAAPTNTERDTLSETTRVRVPLRIGRRNQGGLLTGASVQDVRIYQRELAPRESAALAAAHASAATLAKRPDARSEDELARLCGWWLTNVDSESVAAVEQLASLERERDAIRARGGVAHVVQEKETPPEAYVLHRGEYDQRRDRVTPSTPDFLPPMPEELPRDRLGFAKWLLLPEHPLTARVTVNRCWQELFGTGLVATAGDFGVAGGTPSHPELLDWLAVEFRESGWDVKQLYRLMVTSAAYRQAAVATPEKLEKDRANRLLSRGPRFRMDAEMVRDYALAASDLLAGRIGGPSVKPYQPPGVWEAVAMQESNTRYYQRDEGDALYRRSMYTFWKRAAPPASMDIFNAPSREFCTVTRERTNTPLQALVTLNDTQFFEAARRLAECALKEASGFDQRLDYVTARLISRSFDEQERRLTQESYEKLREEFTSHPERADMAIHVGETEPDGSLDTVQLATWTTLVNELMNLDEALNK